MSKKYKQIILLPAGGTGNRFKDNGYDKPKALINIFGRPIISYLLDNLKLTEATLVYITYNKEYEKYRLEDSLKKMYPEIDFKFHQLQHDTEGAAHTVNIALTNLDLNYDIPVLCLDIDNFYTDDILSKWAGTNGVLYFNDTGESAIYSYVDFDDTGVLDIQEKNKISDNACCGAYGFKSYRQLLKYTSETIAGKVRVKNEFYMSTCIRRMLTAGIKFEAVEVNKADFHCLGTPSQLKLFYNNWPNISCVDLDNKNAKLKICFDLDNTLVTYPHVAGDYSTVQPIENNINFLKYLKKFGHTIIIQTARRMKTHNSNVGALVADIGKVTIETLEKFDIPYDELYFGKPHADFYIDDNAVSAYANLEKEIGFYHDTIKPRDFNSVEIETIEIYTKKSENLAGEIYYYNNIPKELKDMFPVIINYDTNNQWYSIERINGLTLSNMYLSQLMNYNILHSVMESIQRIQTVSIPEDADTDIDIYANYVDKLDKRYEEYDYTKHKSSKEMYQDIRNHLEDYCKTKSGKLTCIHGDPVFSNILINKYHKVKFIDMRGAQGDKLSIYGDWLYDWSKLYQSLLGYDEILLDKEVSTEYKNKMLEDFESIFLKWYTKRDFKNLKNITNSLLFTLLPLHDNNKCDKYYNLINNS